MSDAVRAQRADIRIGAIAIDGFMLPDGTYRMSQAQAAQAIEEPPVYALRFLRSKASKALLGEGYTDYTPESIEVQTEEGRRGQTRFNALPLEVVSAYWLTKANQGNKRAFTLCWALLSENLERRFDNAFGVTRTEQERDDLLNQRIQRLESDLQELGTAYAEPDDLRERVSRLEDQIRQMGGEPWQLPSNNEQ